MSYAKHLAIFQIGWTALTPCFDVVGFHFLEIPYLFLVDFTLHHTVRTIADVLFFCLFGLAVVENGLLCLVKYTDI